MDIHGLGGGGRGLVGCGSVCISVDFGCAFKQFIANGQFEIGCGQFVVSMGYILFTAVMNV